MTYLKVVFDEALLQDKKTLAPGTQLMAPDPVNSSYGSYEALINSGLPPEHPSIYGLHPNVEIAFLTESADALFSTILKLNAGTGGADEKEDGDGDGDGSGGGGGGGGVGALLDSLLERIPPLFDMIELGEKVRRGRVGPGRVGSVRVGCCIKN